MINLLFPALLLCFVTCTLSLLDAHTRFQEITSTTGFKLGILLVCAYGAGYLLYRIVAMYTEYRVTLDYQ